LLAAQTPADAVKSLVDAENAFAALAGQKGIKTAFLSFMDKDAIVFKPEPVRAQEFHESRKDDEALLYWVPEFVQISGGLGWTTGPWEYRAEKMQEQPVATGHFITVWKRQKDGSWNWLLDAGISHPMKRGVKPVGVDHVMMIAPRADKAEIERVRKALLAMENAFAKGARKTWGDLAYSAGKYARVYRDGSPILNPNGTAFISMKAVSGEVIFVPDSCGVSESADLAYTYGMGSFHPGEAKAPMERFS
jgi:hypothetical protein